MITVSTVSILHLLFYCSFYGASESDKVPMIVEDLSDEVASVQFMDIESLKRALTTPVLIGNKAMCTDAFGA